MVCGLYGLRTLCSADCMVFELFGLRTVWSGDCLVCGLYGLTDSFYLSFPMI